MESVTPDGPRRAPIRWHVATVRDARAEFPTARTASGGLWGGRELLATGESVCRRVVETREVLTAQEAQIARLAGEGLSNPEIDSRLFISPRTVEYHLHKGFTKLGISSRN